MSEEIDLLAQLENMDLSEVSTGMPVLPQGLYEVEVLESKSETNKKGTGSNWKLKLGLTQPTTSLDGKSVNPNFPIFTTISLVQTEKYDPKQNLASFLECFTGTKAHKLLPFEQFVSMRGNIRLGVKTSDEYGQQNVIARWIKKA